MIVIQQAPLALLVVFLLSLGAAAAVDVWKRQVPNLLVIAVALSGLAAFIVSGHWELVWQPLLVVIAILAVGTPMFGRGWVGGGDIKLMAAAACWFTAKASLQFLASALLAGGALALLAVGWRLARRKKVSRQSSAAIPYAVAIAAGAAWQVWQYRF